MSYFSKYRSMDECLKHEPPILHHNCVGIDNVEVDPGFYPLVGYFIILGLLMLIFQILYKVFEKQRKLFIYKKLRKGLENEKRKMGNRR